MNPLLRDFCAHQAWADAEHWSAIEAHPLSAEDPVLRHRLHHIHLVQRAFLWAVGDRAAALTLTTPEEFSSLAALKQYARGTHEAFDQFFARVSDARLEERIVMPWFTDPPLTLTVTEALTQAAMHSHYHRGQNATRLRELGGEPPLTDLIAWYWKGRPGPDWGTPLGTRL